MKPIALAGLALIVLGVAGLAVGRFSYPTEEKVLEIGPITAKVDERHDIAIPDIAAIAAILAGAGLMFVSRRTA